MKKVLQILGGIGYGGAEAFVMNQFRNMKSEYIFDFAVQVQFDKYNSYEDEITSLGGSVYYTGLFRSSPLKYAKSIEQIVRENGPYAAVHIHVNEQCGFAAMGARWAGVKSIIVHAHSSQYGQKNPVIKILMLSANRLLCGRNANHVVACSKEAASMYFGKCGEKKAVILKNPIDIDKYYYAGDRISCREMLNIKSEIVISHIGRFIDVKNHDFILELCKKLDAEQVDYVMLLVGDGPLRPAIEEKVRESNLEKNRIRFLGQRSDIPQILRASDVMILPSKYEGLPTVVLEAQASGTPSIVSLNVNNNCDLGIGLVDFLKINDNESTDIWKTSVCNPRKHLGDYNIICDGFKNNGISLDIVSDVLRGMYK